VCVCVFVRAHKCGGRGRSSNINRILFLRRRDYSVKQNYFTSSLGADTYNHCNVITVCVWFPSVVIKMCEQVIIIVKFLTNENVKSAEKFSDETLT
jgi:hypothetical protein